MPAAALHDAPGVSNEIVDIESLAPLTSIQNDQAVEAFYQAVSTAARSVGSDVTTKKGREAIKSAAYKVSRVKTQVDNLGKAEGEDARKVLNQVNEARKKIRDRLANLQEEVRRPLTAWEEEEKQRVEAVQAGIAQLNGIISQPALITDTAAVIADRLADLKVMEIRADIYREETERVEALRDQAISALTEAHTVTTTREKEAAELTELRRKAAEQEAKEREAQEARERAEREAADAARREEEAKRREAEAAERARQEERDRHAREEAEKRAAAQKLEAERQRKAENKRHQAAVMRKAETSLRESTDLEADQARAVIAAIVDGKVRNVTINF